MSAADATEIDVMDLCNAQIMMWFEAQATGSSGYRLGGWLKTDQPFDVDRLREALTLLMNNHEALRLRVDTDQPRQWVLPKGEV